MKTNDKTRWHLTACKRAKHAGPAYLQGVLFLASCQRFLNAALVSGYSLTITFNVQIRGVSRLAKSQTNWHIPCLILREL